MVKRIRGLCEKTGISISTLERELGFARGYVYKLEKSNPTVDNAKKIADYFGVTLDSLLAEDSEAGQEGA